MAGYYKNPKATAAAVDADGWLHTGDLARSREDGNYRIVGRSKELIIRGGENIYPPEVEEFIHHHPAVAEVAIVGLPDVKFGEVVAAWVVVRPNSTLCEDEIRNYCRGQIAHFKVPHYIRIVTELPRTVTGKIRKHVLRESGIEHFGLGEASAIPTA
jgi:fatty-acyl-CoA synthase